MPSLWYNSIYRNNATVILDVRDPCAYILERARPGIFIIASFSQTLVDPVSTITEMLNSIPSGYDIHKYLFILVNSPAEYRELAQFHSALNIYSWSNACRTFAQDDEIFSKSIITYNERKFDGVMCSKNVKFKRHSLTWGIPNIKYLISCDHSPCKSSCKCLGSQICDNCMWDNVPLKNIQDNKHLTSEITTDVPLKKVCNELHNARCGIILSPSEGSCYASLEYLLHGLPVISTQSTGGRANYYDNINSITCDASREGVEAALTEINRRWKNGEIDPYKIRKQAVKQQQYYLNMYKNILADIFKMQSVDIDATKYFEDNIKPNFQPRAQDINDENCKKFNDIISIDPRPQELVTQQAPFRTISTSGSTIVWVNIAVEWNNLKSKWVHNLQSLANYIATGRSVKFISRIIHKDQRTVYLEGRRCLISSSEKPQQANYVCGVYASAHYDSYGKLCISMMNKAGDHLPLHIIQ
jgi:hypothetical protein